MKFSRWIFVTGTLFLLAICFSAQAFAVKLDGIIGEVEWNGCKKEFVFYNEYESNCAVQETCLRILENPSTNEIFVGLMVSEENFNKNYFDEASRFYGKNSPIAVRLTVNGTELVIGLNGELEYDKEPYHVSACFLPNESFQGYTAEIRIGVKREFPLINKYILQLVDAAGEPSSLYRTEIDRTPPPTTEPVTVTTTLMQTTAKPAATKKPTTTSPPKNVPNTTRRWVVKKKEKTTAPKTTKPLSTVQTTEKPTVKIKTKTAAKETQSSASTTEYKTQVEASATTDAKTEQSAMETKYIIVSDLPENNNKGQMKTSHKIVLAVCIVAFILFAAYGYYLKKHKKSE